MHKLCIAIQPAVLLLLHDITVRVKRHVLRGMGCGGLKARRTPYWEVGDLFAVTKPELGIKRRCNRCEAKLFDLNKDPIVCPKCQAVFTLPQPEPTRSPRPT